MRHIVSVCLLLTVLFGSVGVHAFGQWEPEGSSYDILEEAIFDLERDIERAIEGRSASPAFLDALEEHVVQLYSVLAQLQDEADPAAEYRDETPAGVLTVGSRSEYAPAGVPLNLRLAPAATIPTHERDGNRAEVEEDFWISETLVTYELWHAVHRWALDNGYAFANSGREGSHGPSGERPSEQGSHPVTEINWADAVVWCNALSEMKGYEPVYTTDGRVLRNANQEVLFEEPTVERTGGFRLPGSWEWELAARYQGEDSSHDAVEVDGLYWTPGSYASGAVDARTNEEATSAVAWWDGNTDSTQPVGQLQPNALGLFDMSGNVQEWTDSSVRIRSRAAGGSWSYSRLEIGNNTSPPKDRVQDDLGFRVAQSIL